MVKHKRITWTEFLSSRLKERKDKKDKMPKLTTDEYIKFKAVRSEGASISLSFIAYPFYCMFYIALFVLVVRLGFGIDFRLTAMMITILVFKTWGLGLVLTAIILILLNASIDRKNRRIYERIISERKK